MRSPGFGTTMPYVRERESRKEPGSITVVRQADQRFMPGRLLFGLARQASSQCAIVSPAM